MTFTVKKRFIAGAVCPRCGEMDKLVTYKQDGEQWRECVGCGFADKIRFTPNPQELTTRVNITENASKAEVQILNMPAPPDG